MQLRKRKCAICRAWFMPKAPYERWCCPEHGTQLAIKLREKERQLAIQAAERRRKRKELEGKRQHQKRKLAIQPLSYFIKKAQQSFNEYIRERDKDQPCISCGETNPPDLHGGQWDCGHFLSVGAHPELRFDERNAYKQCKSCNAGAGKFSHKNATVTQKYEQRLVERFGQGLVDWLRGPHEMPHWKREELEDIAAKYRRKTKELRQETLCEV